MEGQSWGVCDSLPVPKRLHAPLELGLWGTNYRGGEAGPGFRAWATADPQAPESLSHSTGG